VDISISAPNGFFEAPPYALDRYSTSVGGLSYDFAPIRQREIWTAAFGQDEIDWADGWRRYWSATSDQLGTGSDYSPDRVGLEMGAFFGDNRQWSQGVGLSCDISDIDEWMPKALANFDWGLNGDDPVSGLIGLVLDETHQNTRPCLTLMVSGPGGSVEAVMAIRLELANRGVNSGVFIRTVRQGTTGILKVCFMPEFSLLPGVPPGFGLDWKLWRSLAPRNPAAEWATAALIWCDVVAAVAGSIKQDLPLMVDGMYFDFMSVVPIFSGNPFQQFDENPYLLVDQLNAPPHTFMFR
jgi:hypothetical protein